MVTRNELLQPGWPTSCRTVDSNMANISRSVKLTARWSVCRRLTSVCVTSAAWVELWYGLGLRNGGACYDYTH